MKTDGLIKEQETATRVYNLVIELAQAKQQKKAALAGFNDEIKRITAEINSQISAEEGGTKTEK